MTAADPQLFVLSMVGEHRRLLSVREVREIVPAMAVTQPEHVSAGFRGLMNLRGDLIPVFDPECRSRAFEPSQLIVVMRHESGPIGLLVDDVMDVIEVAPEHVFRVATGAGRQLTSVSLGGLTVTVLSAEEVVRAA